MIPTPNNESVDELSEWKQHMVGTHRKNVDKSVVIGKFPLLLHLLKKL